MKASPIRCLVSAGPTREFFDPVRFVSNPSTGKMGFALAAAAFRRGWHVDLVSGPVALETPVGVHRIDVVTGQEMLEALEVPFKDCDILIMTAAILDYRPCQKAPVKVKKSSLPMRVEMEPVPDVLQTLASSRSASQVLVGFAAETNNMEAYATEKLMTKGADFIVANQIGGAACAFGNPNNSVMVFSHELEPIRIGPLKKEQIAEQLITIFQERLTRSFEASRPHG